MLLDRLFEVSANVLRVVCSFLEPILLGLLRICSNRHSVFEPIIPGWASRRVYSPSPPSFLPPENMPPIWPTPAPIAPAPNCAVLVRPWPTPCTVPVRPSPSAPTVLPSVSVTPLTPPPVEQNRYQQHSWGDRDCRGTQSSSDGSDGLSGVRGYSLGFVLRNLACDCSSVEKMSAQVSGNRVRSGSLRLFS